MMNMPMISQKAVTLLMITACFLIISPLVCLVSGVVQFVAKVNKTITSLKYLSFDILIILSSWLFVSEYMKLNKKFCSGRYGTYRTIQSAMTACSTDANCQGVYDKGCDATGYLIDLCPTSAIYKDSEEGSCIYQKNKNCKYINSFHFYE